VLPVGDLLRVARSSGGELVLGRTAPGRGVWLCLDSLACLDAARGRDAFSRAFRAAVEATAVEALRAGLLDRARMESSEKAVGRD
jgi:predicted RNA-binding protein YlxR (DUF448 family)